MAAGPVGRTAEAGITPTAAVYTYSRSQGLFGGISLEGMSFATKRVRCERPGTTAATSVRPYPVREDKSASGGQKASKSARALLRVFLILETFRPFPVYFSKYRLNK